MTKDITQEEFLILYMVSSASYFLGYFLIFAKLGQLGYFRLFGEVVSNLGLLGYAVVVIANGLLWYSMSRG